MELLYSTLPFITNADMNGTFDELGYFNRALTSSEISQLASLSTHATDISGVIASWSFSTEISPKNPSVTAFWSENYGISTQWTGGFMFLPSLAQANTFLESTTSDNSQSDYSGSSETHELSSSSSISLFISTIMMLLSISILI